MRLTWIGFVLFVFAASWVTPGVAVDWPVWRGPNQDGTVVTGNACFDEAFALEVAWRRPLGSAYSGIAVAGQTLVTFAAVGEADWLIALDAATGDERWRVRVNDKYVGHDGSDDGPSSTPVIAHERVFAVGARGRLLAVDLQDGSIAWERDLGGSFGGSPSSFGYASTPLVVDDLIVVATGGEQGAFAAFERAGGQLRWRTGQDRIEYQSPVLATLAGERVVLAPGSDLLLGLEPATGRELFRADYGPRPRYSTTAVVPVPGDRLLLDPWQDTVLYGVTRSDGAFELAELWRETTLDGRLSTSVWHEEHVYGFDGRFLSCVDGATGQKVWKSRPPGGGGLILVDGHLVILGKGGDLVIVRATPDGYDERARIHVLDEPGVTYPSYAGGRIFVRNTSEIAAVAIGPAGTASREDVSTDDRAGGVIAELVERLGRSDTPHLVIDDFMRAQGSFPVIEPDGLVHFVWRGEAEDVAIEGSHLGWAEEPLERLSGTDLWYRSERFGQDARIEYRFNVDFDAVGPDPANPHRVPAEWDADYSVLAMPGASEPGWLRAWHGDAGGRVERFTHASAALGNEREIVVWTPPGHRRGAGSGLLLVLEGRRWIDKGMLLDVLRHRVGSDVGPLVTVFVGRPASGGSEELAGRRTDDFVRMLADELVPLLTERYGTTGDAGGHAVVGRWSGAFAAVVAGIDRPEIFGHVGAVSVIERDALDGLLERITATPPSGTLFHLAWNRFERWDGDSVTASVRDALRARGYDVRGGERPETAGWSGWRVWAGELFERLFPVSPAP